MNCIDDNRVDSIVTEAINAYIKHYSFPIGNTNCIGVPSGLMEFNRYEYEPILIVEERSVAAYKYRGVIQLISNQIEECIYNNDFEEFSIDLNKIPNVNVDLADEVIVSFVFNNKWTEAKYMEHDTVFDKNTKHAKTVFFVIFINPYRYNESLIRQFMFHEINHCKEDVCRRANGSDDLETSLENIKYQEAYKNKENDIFAYLTYYVMIDTELNSYASQVYDELASMQSIRKNFSGDIQDTQSYKQYKKYEGYLEKLRRNTNWEQRAMYYYNDCNMSVSAFRKWYLDKMERNIRRYWYMICKAASLYYDTIENEQSSG